MFNPTVAEGITKDRGQKRKRRQRKRIEEKEECKLEKNDDISKKGKKEKDEIRPRNEGGTTRGK